MRVLLTGAAGFLGWHTHVRLRALTDHHVIPVTRANWEDLDVLAGAVDAVIHVAGVNRGSEHEVSHENVRLAQQVATAVRNGGGQPRIVFANSTRAAEPSPYGEGKALAATVLAELAAEVGTEFVDVRLPNLFGESGRPRYNSFVATFVEAVLAGQTPVIEDRPIGLLHAQQAAQALIDGLDGPSVTAPEGTLTRVASVYDRLAEFHHLYVAGDIPPLRSDLDLDLFNTLRAAMFPAHFPLPLPERSDARGSLVEVVRAHGGQGQTFVSTTRPGETRGEHFHLRKVERFVVIEGQAQISMRRVCGDDQVRFAVDGVRPVVVDMPTLWAHNITNTGKRDLTTIFWTNELFDADRPDTYRECVELDASLVGAR